MRKFCTFAVGIIVSNVVFAGFKEEPLNIKGDVLTIVEKSYSASMKFGELTQSEDPGVTSTYYFNSNHSLKESEEFYDDVYGNKKRSYFTKCYYSNTQIKNSYFSQYFYGNTRIDSIVKYQINVQEYDITYSDREVTKYEYNSDGIHSISIFSNHKLTSKEIYHYDGEEPYSYLYNGEGEEKNSFQYHDDGEYYNEWDNEGHHYYFNYDGQLVKMTFNLGPISTNIDFKYDKYGNVLEKYYAQNIADIRRSYKYDYDAQGNWIKRTETIEEIRGSRIFKTEYKIKVREITYATSIKSFQTLESLEEIRLKPVREARAAAEEQKRIKEEEQSRLYLEYLKQEQFKEKLKEDVYNDYDAKDYKSVTVKINNDNSLSFFDNKTLVYGSSIFNVESREDGVYYVLNDDKYTYIRIMLAQNDFTSGTIFGLITSYQGFLIINAGSDNVKVYKLNDAVCKKIVNSLPHN